MFESATGIERNRIVQLVLAIVLVVAATLFVLSTRRSAPRPSEVEGVYVNSCCSDVIIGGGALSYGGVTYPVRFCRMKFGLAGYVNQKFSAGAAEPSTEPTVILFMETNGEQSLTLPVKQRDTIFLKRTGRP